MPTRKAQNQLMRFSMSFVVLLMNSFLCLMRPPYALSQPSQSPTPVAVGTVVEQSVATAMEVVGTVGPYLATTLSAEIGGLTMRFDLKEGDAVQEGQTIVVQLKASDLELALAEAQAAYSRAKQEAHKLETGAASREDRRKAS